MPRAKVEHSSKYYTAPQARQQLGLSRRQFDLRIERNVLPQPTFTDDAGVRYFDEQWIRIARAILDNSKEAEPGKR